MRRTPWSAWLRRRGNGLRSARFLSPDRSMRESGFDVSFASAAGAATIITAGLLEQPALQTEKDWRKWQDARKQGESQRGPDKPNHAKNNPEISVDASSVSSSTTPRQKSAQLHLHHGVLPAVAGRHENRPRIGKEPSKLEQPAARHEPYEPRANGIFPMPGRQRKSSRSKACANTATTPTPRISYNFVSMIAENFHRDGTIREKYKRRHALLRNRRQSRLQHQTSWFGWTNAAVVVFLHEMPQELARSSRANKQLAAK